MSDLKKKRVAMAMSGGVDSSVAAALLLEQGYDVIGLHMKLHNYSPEGQVARRCCSLDDALDARGLCAKLKIPFYVIDFKADFQANVIDYFISEYQQGRTPNPCVMCNRTIKIHPLLEKVKELGCDYLATGHYAKVTQNKETGRYEMRRPRDMRKDQTYFLHGTPQEDLPKLLFPLANYTKSAIREVAEDLSTELANKPDSQEVCFVPKDYRVFLKNNLDEMPKPGNFVSLDGKVLGKHDGIPFYTIGQRRGLGVSGPHPYFVIDIRPDSNEVVLGHKEDATTQKVWVSDVNWVSIDPIQEPRKAFVKLRYAHQGVEALLIPKANDRVCVELSPPEAVVAPGQAAVFYDDDVLLGGGWIERCE